MFTFTPLLGAQSSSSKASQSILELDGGIKILVDVGWDDTFDPLDLQELETCSHSFLNPSDPRYPCAYWCLRALLQDLPSFYSDSRLRHEPRYCAWSYTTTGSIRLLAASCNIPTESLDLGAGRINFCSIRRSIRRSIRTRRRRRRRC